MKNKNKKSNIIINFLYSSIYQILLIILPLITSPYVSRVLGAKGLGIYSYTYAIANCFALVGMLGVNNYGNRTIAAVQGNREKRSKAFWNILSLQASVTAIVATLYLCFILFICSPEYRTMATIHLITVLTSMIDINWFFFGMEKFRITVTRNIIIKLLNVTAIFLFVRKPEDVWIYTLIMTGGNFISCLVVWPFLKREVDFVRPTFHNIISHFKQTAVLFIPVIAVTLYKKMDKVMLGAMSPLNENGFYENTEKIVNIPMGLITALGTVMLPRMSNLFASGNKKETRKYLQFSMEFVCFMSCALAFGMAAVSKEFAPVFFGKEFSNINTLITMIAPTVVFISWANVIRTQYLIPLHYDRPYVISVWLGAVVNLVVNYLLIPKYGAMGAVIGTVFAEGVVMLYQTIFVRNMLPIGLYIKRGIYFIFAGAVMYAAVRMVGDRGGKNLKTLVIEIIAGGLTYIICCRPYIWILHKSEIKDFLKNKKSVS